MKPFVTSILVTLLSGSAFAQEVLPYVNLDEQERFDRITKPFLTGKIAPMEPSNFQDSSQCVFAPEAIEWLREKRAGTMKPGYNHRLNIYLYNQYLSVLETRDCSCAGKSPTTEHTIKLFAALPVDEHTGLKVGGDFYSSDKTVTLDRLTHQFCGGRV